MTNPIDQFEPKTISTHGQRRGHGSRALIADSSPPRLVPSDGPGNGEHEGGAGAERPQSGFRSDPGPAEQASLFRELRQASPQTADRVAEGLTAMPEPGTDFFGFRLVEELGRGAFGRVFLARQHDLANRPVALKVTTNALGESWTLAQLQHTNIVPIHSVHAYGSLQAVCMPYFGATTLGSLLSQWHRYNSLPASGKELVQTLVSRVGRTSLASSVAAAAAASKRSATEPLQEPVAETVPAPALPGAQPTSILDMLQGLSYVDSVLWMGSRLADGLAHAHERGIIHRDLKPANVLLTDEGQPMLLDFGVAQDVKLRSMADGALVGGTLPYMAPEHLQAIRGGELSPVDARSDLYSFGVILYELLTRRDPFPLPQGSLKESLPAMIADRLKPPPRLRGYNRAVSPAVESIVRHCLAPDPARRYQTARELQEDLERQRGNLPLKYAPEPSLRERVGKWVRRHPRVTSTSSMAAVAAVLALTIVGLLVVRGDRLSQFEARDSFLQFQEERKAAQFFLSSRTPDAEQIEEGVAQCKRALERYHVLEQASWDRQPAVRRLPAEDQARLRADVGELLLLQARATALQAQSLPEPAWKERRLQEALRQNELAGATFGIEGAPRAVWSQRAEFADLLGRAEEAESLRARARATPLSSARDYYLEGTDHLTQGRFRDALPLLQEATEQDPQHFWARFALGACYDGLGQLAEARASYTAAIGLSPSFHWAYFNRGILFLRQSEFKRAVADFDQVLRQQPSLADAYVNRALAHQGLKEYEAADADLTRALEFGASAARVYCTKASLWEVAGDRERSRKDLEEGLRHTPSDEKSWLARGIARLSGDPKAALADFEQALSVNPRSLVALQNKAHLLSKSGQNEEAVRVLNRVVTLYPDYVPARAGRGVLEARLKQWEAAREDAAEALWRDSSPANVYQVAGIYALCSQDNPDDFSEALLLLGRALRSGFGFNYLAIDKDLDPVRERAEFRKLVETARARQAKPVQQP